MTHDIKTARSQSLAPHVPSAQMEISASISDYLTERLTASELAEVRRCLNTHWHKAIAFAERSICGEGCVWDASHQCLREIQGVRYGTSH